MHSLTTSLRRHVGLLTLLAVMAPLAALAGQGHSAAARTFITSDACLGSRDVFLGAVISGQKFVFTEFKDSYWETLKQEADFESMVHELLPTVQTMFTEAELTVINADALSPSTDFSRTVVGAKLDEEQVAITEACTAAAVSFGTELGHRVGKDYRKPKYRK